ncbi:anaerobic C4-dicarboxylate transporter DcuC [Propioniferax innocua]|uniref:DcuC family C4-dicarboxylate transporter n=1 Tax=Propioniferax innocua TaxID=1753 RepID=A0A542Z7D3_9ACTN|nr:anaerobic C4-dicarboxylate transporter DcuC [Propioniferax innocua]TQL56252.1 DcuC family C4-dicarboxylate transporter [Propioniferax innocua]
MVSILIGLAVMAGAGYLIFKKMSPTGILLLAGLLLLAISLLMGRDILGEDMESTGWGWLDSIDFIRYMMTDRIAGLGLMIMILVGFAGYMSHIGANDAVVRLLIRPLSMFKSPYLVMCVAFLLGCAMTLAVGSATGLGVLLMATFFPIMTRVGVSKYAATTICASTASVIISPVTADVVLAAEKAKEPLIDFGFKQTLPVSLITLAVLTVLHFFWQRFLDRRALAKEGKEQLDIDEQLAQSQEDGKITKTAPLWYAILPFLPIILVFVFNGNLAPKLELVTLIIIAIMIAAIIEFIRQKARLRKVLDGLEVGYKGMGDAFSSVVMLVIAASIFAHGLATVGFVDALIGGVQNAGGAGVLVMIALTVITIVVTITTGSGNSAFYAFVELAPKLASELGVRGAYLIIPMLEASNMARPLSPVSGVVVACAGIAKINPLEIVKRASVPSLGAAVVMVITSMILVPLH